MTEMRQFDDNCNAIKPSNGSYKFHMRDATVITHPLAMDSNL